MAKTKKDKTPIERFKKFLKKNDFEFSEGRRNSDSVPVAGFAIYLGFDIHDADELIDVIYRVYSSTAEDFDEEFEKVLSFAEENNYGEWWSTAAASKMYTF